MKIIKDSCEELGKKRKNSVSNTGCCKKTLQNVCSVKILLDRLSNQYLLLEVD